MAAMSLCSTCNEVGTYNNDCSKCVVSACRSTFDVVADIPDFTPSAPCASPSVTMYRSATSCAANCRPISAPAVYSDRGSLAGRVAVQFHGLDMSHLLLASSVKHRVYTTCSVYVYPNYLVMRCLLLHSNANGDCLAGILSCVISSSDGCGIVSTVNRYIYRCILR